MSPLILPYREKTPRVASDAFVAPGAAVIGDVEIASLANVWFACVLRGDVNHIRVGARTSIQDGTVVHVARRRYPTIIGSDVLVGHRAVLHACVLEDGSFIGMNAVVMDGAVVESGAMVAAGALVSPQKRVPSGEIWAGVPAGFKRRLTEAERRRLSDSTARYVRLGTEYRARLAGL